MSTSTVPFFSGLKTLIPGSKPPFATVFTSTVPLMLNTTAPSNVGSKTLFPVLKFPSATVHLMSNDTVIIGSKTLVMNSPFATRTIAKISKEDVVEEVFGRMWWCAMLLV